MQLCIKYYTFHAEASTVYPINMSFQVLYGQIVQSYCKIGFIIIKKWKTKTVSLAKLIELNKVVSEKN